MMNGQEARFRPILDASDFLCAIRIERDRSRRSGLPFCVGVAQVSAPDAWRVAWALRTRLRLTDEVGRVGATRVAVLLPYTDRLAARWLHAELHRQLTNEGFAMQWRGAPRRFLRRRGPPAPVAAREPGRSAEILQDAAPETASAARLAARLVVALFMAFLPFGHLHRPVISR